MKVLIPLFVLALISSNCFSQSLEGEWKGSFTYYFTNPNTPYYTYQTNNKPIRIVITLNADSTYTGLSYSAGPDSRGKDTTYVCSVLCRKISSDSAYLQEVKTINPNNVSNDCMQKMYLKFGKRKRSVTLEGKWETNHTRCNNNGGEIILYKKISG